MGKHSKPHRSWGPYVTTGIALEAAAIFGFAYASDSHVSPPNLLAATIFVDGTKSITGSEEGVPFFGMADSFQSAYDLPGFDKVFIEYPRSLGPLTGQAGRHPFWASTICTLVTTKPSTRMTRPRSSPPAPTAGSLTS